MSNLFNKENLTTTLLASFVIGGVVMYGLISNHEARLTRVEADQMSRELIQTKLNNIVDKIDMILENGNITSKKLDEHIENTSNK